MSMQEASAPTIPAAQVVGNAFVEQYYHILHHKPELVYRFYQDSSILSRQDSNGVMISVTTMQGINEKIVSLDYKKYKAEIKTADAQQSCNNGVTILVTGCLTGEDNLRRKFAQSFFLAPQEPGFFVLNDVFRYVEDDDSLEKHVVDGVDTVTEVPKIAESEGNDVPDPPAPAPTSLVEKDKNIVEKANDASNRDIQIEGGKDSASEPTPHSIANDVSVVIDTTSLPQEDAPKKSYASIVKVAKGSSGPTKVYMPTNTNTNTAKLAPKKSESKAVDSAASAPAPEVPKRTSIDIPESDNAAVEVEGYSIYVRNLPFNSLVSQLEEEFMKFGPIKKEGIQVRNNKQQGYCFGFVEFVSLKSMKDAIQAAPINLLGREVIVEAKRTTSRADGERGRFTHGRGGFGRHDNFRNYGNYGGGGGRGGGSYGRNEYSNRGEFSGRGRGPPRRRGGGGEGYQPVRGRGGGGRLGGPKPNAAA